MANLKGQIKCTEEQYQRLLNGETLIIDGKTYVYDPDVNYVTEDTTQEQINELKTNKQNNLSETQLNAINSGITAEKVTQIDSNKTDITILTNNLKDKLNILGLGESNRVYVRKTENTDSSLPYTYTAEGDSIAYRNASGQMQSETPTQTKDVANKKYVDDKEQKYLSLSGESGTLDDDQYNLITTYDNLIIQRVGLDFRRSGYPSNGTGDYIFFCDHYTKPNGSEEWVDYFITIKQDKSWETTIKNHLQVSEQTYAPFVELTPASATNGTLSDDDYTNLTEHKDVYIILNNEYYYRADDQNTTGILSYTHNGWNGDAPQDKSINITLSTKAWTLAIGKTKYYRHYVQLTAGDKALYYDFSSTQSTAYTADTLPSMPDDIITAFQVVANGYYSSVSGLVYRNAEGALKVIMHGMYTTDGTNMTYLQMTGDAATFVQDVVKTM